MTAATSEAATWMTVAPIGRIHDPRDQPLKLESLHGARSSVQALRETTLQLQMQSLCSTPVAGPAMQGTALRYS